MQSFLGGATCAGVLADARPSAPLGLAPASLGRPSYKVWTVRSDGNDART